MSEIKLELSAAFALTTALKAVDQMSHAQLQEYTKLLLQHHYNYKQVSKDLMMGGPQL
jgi:hypothetical protein